MPSAASYLLILFFFVFQSCGPKSNNTESQTLGKMTSPLSEGNCSGASEFLQIVGDDYTEEFLDLKSTAYACLAGFSKNNFFTSDVPKIDSSLSKKIIPSLVTFSTSVMNSGTDTSFLYLQKAIDTILYSGPTTLPSAAIRLLSYGQEKGNSLNIQALYLILAQLGKFMSYYGNAKKLTGVKGSCIYTYTDSVALDLVGRGLTGSCVNPPKGAPELSKANNRQKVKILCQGAVLFGNMMDIFQNATIPAESRSFLDPVFNHFMSEICLSGSTQVNAICALTSQAVCESTYATTAQFSDLEVFYASFVESHFL